MILLNLYFNHLIRPVFLIGELKFTMEFCQGFIFIMSYSLFNATHYRRTISFFVGRIE
ncbi:hypothetical protein XCR1_1270010 [Xenorhabdus cabanillasii JM26]|uniref:Uncharacterized protein n=1 Tax=Xenorhabdus cabanillasii JM26 TaxID=1427517 RepID=W1IPW9_9GAMM|nr:hypothetical protein XCR1_1270010 [Xenorhabdus cabanillasii JM26]